MYEKLIEELRTTERICRDRMDGEVMLRAADAIEGLCRRVAKVYCELEKTIEKSYEESKPRWIPVTERLPEWGHYFVFVKAGEYDNISWTQVAYFDGKKFHGVDATATAVVTHWMPLPEPPKEENV